MLKVLGLASLLVFAISALASEFQLHHIIPKKFAKDPVVQASGFQIDAPENLLPLPRTRERAAELTITPHSGIHLDSYLNGVADVLKDLQNTQDYQLARAGKSAAADALRRQVDLLRDKMREALCNGDLYTNYPLQAEKKRIKAINRNFFNNYQNYTNRKRRHQRHQPCLLQ